MPTKSSGRFSTYPLFIEAWHEASQKKDRAALAQLREMAAGNRHVAHLLAERKEEQQPALRGAAHVVLPDDTVAARSVLDDMASPEGCPPDSCLLKNGILQVFWDCVSMFCMPDGEEALVRDVKAAAGLRPVETAVSVLNRLATGSLALMAPKKRRNRSPLHAEAVRDYLFRKAAGRRVPIEDLWRWNKEAFKRGGSNNPHIYGENRGKFEKWIRGRDWFDQICLT